MSEELRKGLEDAVGHLRDFREYEDQLSKWIRQKEKLLDVLGPVAMEPSLLNSQMEQVQVGGILWQLHDSFNCFIYEVIIIIMVCSYIIQNHPCIQWPVIHGKSKSAACDTWEVFKSTTYDTWMVLKSTTSDTWEVFKYTTCDTWEVFKSTTFNI